MLLLFWSITETFDIRITLLLFWSIMETLTLGSSTGLESEVQRVLSCPRSHGELTIWRQRLSNILPPSFPLLSQTPVLPGTSCFSNSSNSFDSRECWPALPLFGLGVFTITVWLQKGQHTWNSVNQGQYSPAHFQNMGSRSLQDMGCSQAQRSRYSILVSGTHNTNTALGDPKKDTHFSKERCFDFHYWDTMPNPS